MPLLRALRSAAAGICVLLAATAAAAEEQKPLLTAKEIADGWVLLFDGETTFGWEGKAEVKDGALRIAKGEAVTFPVPLPPGQVVLEAAGCEVAADVGGAGATPRRTLPADAVSTVTIDRTKAGTKAEAVITTTTGGTTTSVLRAPAGGENLAARWKLVLTGGAGGGRLLAARFRPAGTEPLFNGKDLTGWKVFKDEKRSRTAFAVTAAGELSAKNGPGDLQSEKQFDDFLLQLECKTNGAALNSGVFFRCVADQYQNGYEMQIQNAYKEGDRTKPADFGTGAIYRRVPARKVVSNDNEWFSMTLLAVGPRIATWVNGYPVVSWKDERPANDNPRQGLKTGKGHLSIQGHDATTDLLFRNLRAAEVK